ncbi:hypothetical protein GCM10010441_26320 [Kitasatospora paracochleata]
MADGNEDAALLSGPTRDGCWNQLPIGHTVRVSDHPDVAPCPLRPVVDDRRRPPTVTYTYFGRP